MDTLDPEVDTLDPEAEGSDNDESSQDNEQSAWYEQLGEDAAKDPEVTKYKEPGEFYKGYKEKVAMIGKKGVILPGENATPKDKERFLNAIGRPKSPEEYKLNPIEGLHESIKPTPETTAAFQAEAHKMGFTNDQANQLNTWYLKQVSGMAQAQDKADTEAMQTAETALRSDWGEKFEANKNMVAKMMLGAGGEEAIQALGDKANDPTVLKALGKIAGLLNEDQIGNLKPLNTPAPGSESKEQAQAKIKEYSDQLSDPKSAISDENNPGHKAAVAERTRLYGIAYGGE